MVPASVLVLLFLGAACSQDANSSTDSTNPMTTSTTTSTPDQGMTTGPANNTSNDDDLLNFFDDSDETDDTDTNNPSGSGDVLMDTCKNLVQRYGTYGINNVTYTQDKCQLNCFGGMNTEYQGFGNENIKCAYNSYQISTNVNDMMSCSEDKKKDDMVCFQGSCIKTDPDSFETCTRAMNKKSIALQGHNECKIRCVSKGNVTTQYNSVTVGLVTMDISLPDGLPCSGQDGMCEQGNCLSKATFTGIQRCT